MLAVVVEPRRLWIAGLISAASVSIALLMWPSAPAGRGAEGDDAEGAGSSAGDSDPGDGADDDPGRGRDGHGDPLSAADRRTLVLAIERARETRLAAVRSESAGGPPPRGPGAGTTDDPGGDRAQHDDPGSLDPEYIRDGIREVMPLVRECYELALATTPGLQGRLVVEVVMTGEPDVGGVIEESTIAEDSDLRDATLDECIRETMFTLHLPAPEEGGRIRIRYPFTMSAAQNEDDGVQGNPSRHRAPPAGGAGTTMDHGSGDDSTDEASGPAAGE